MHHIQIKNFKSVPEKHFFFHCNAQYMVKTSTERLWLTFLQLMLIRNLIYLLFGISFRGKWMSKQIYIWVLTGYRRQSCRSNTNSSFSKKRKKKNKWIFILCQVWENHSMMEFRWPALRYKYVSGLQEKAKNLNYLGGWMVKSRRKFSPSVINLVWKKKQVWCSFYRSAVAGTAWCLRQKKKKSCRPKNTTFGPVTRRS